MAIKVFFETKSFTSEHIATFEDDEVYAEIAPALEAWAEKNGGFITETENN